VYAIIPARSESKRVKSKNIINLGNHPLLAYSITICKLSNYITNVIVSTDCKNIAKIAKRYGASVPFLRPREFAEDNSSDFGYLNHFFENVDTNEVALVRPTSPLRNPRLFDSAINYYINNRDTCTGMRTMCQSSHSPYKMMKINNNICSGFFEEFKGEKFYTNLPNQLFPLSYTPNGYIDIVKKQTIKKGTVFGDTILPIITEKIIDIDDYFDLDIASALIDTKYDLLSVHLDKL
jgi:CMP-N,N'-diacetyllegionaminic acid synthase